MNNKSVRASLGALFPSALLFCIAGCGAAPAPDQVADQPTAEEPTGEVSQAVVGTVVGSWSDWSGQVSIRLYRCPAVFASTGTKTAVCSVDSDFALVGGGAEICRFDPGSAACSTANLQWNPGVLLVGSSPFMQPSPIDGHLFNDGATWAATAKDHFVATSYWLRAYAIGMKLSGVANTRTEVLVTGVGSQVDPNTARCSPSLPADFILAGGGAFGSFPAGNNGELITRSFPGNLGDKCWWGESTGNPFGSDPQNKVNVVGIGVRRCPVGFSGCLTNGVFTVPGGTVSTGYAQSFVAVPTTQPWWATTSIGGEATGSPVSRFLTDMIPSTGNGQGANTVWSKDHVNAASGSNNAQLLVIAKQ